MPAEYVPDYLRIAADVAQKIRSGQWPPGSKLPTKQELAAMYGTSIGPVEHAMIRLKALDLINGRQGKGVYVANIIPDAPSTAGPP